MEEQTIFNMDWDIISKKIIATVLLITLFTSCEKICDCAKSTGSFESEMRNPSGFSKIELYNNIDLVVHFDSITKVKVTAGKNLISEITTNVSDGILRIKNENHCNWVRDFNTSIVVEVWTPSINNLLTEDATGDIYFADSLNCSYFNFDSFSSTGTFHLKFKGTEAHVNINTGPADVFCEGTINNFYLYGAGYGKLDCLNLHSDYVFVTNKGTNNCYVSVQQLINASIYGDGNIYYKGNPTSVLKNEFGKGKLISL